MAVMQTYSLLSGIALSKGNLRDTLNVVFIAPQIFNINTWLQHENRLINLQTPFPSIHVVVVKGASLQDYTLEFILKYVWF